MGGVPAKEQAEGTARFRLRYGRPGKETFKIERNLRYIARFNEDKSWYEVVGFQDVIQ